MENAQIIAKLISDKVQHTSQDFVDAVQAGAPPSVTRFGDGEAICILDLPGHTADAHPYSRDLGDAVFDSLQILCNTPNCWFGNWFWHPFGPLIHLWVEAVAPGFEHWCPHEIFMHVNTQNPETVSAIYKGIRNLDRHKVLVRPRRIAGADLFFKVDEAIEVPAINGWGVYQDILAQCRKVVRRDSVVLMAYGMPAKPLAARMLWDIGATVLDLGSGVDPLIGIKSREGQWSTDYLKQFYGDIMP